MEKIFREAVELLRQGDPFVVATVVNTKGSTPAKSGAKLLVRKDGSVVGTVGGGCVEGDIWFAAKELMREGGSAQHREHFLNEELAARDGLVCGGTMYFLIDPVYQPEAYLPYAEEIASAYEGGTPVALVSLVKPSDTLLAPVGAKLLVREDGSTLGTLGDANLEADAIKRALKLIAYDKNEYMVTDDGTEYFIEAYTTLPQLVLMGGGLVSKAVASIANTLGFRIFVIDDRPQFSNKERFPYAVETVVAEFAEGLQQFSINKNTFILIATRGHRFDDVALNAAARTPASYLGLIGSRRKVVLIYEELFRKGIPVERIREVRSPVGLNINARTPEEIAISIVAEMLQFRLGGDGRPMKMDEKLILKANEKAQASLSG